MPPANLAVAAEERGFESVFVTEHTHIPVRPFIRWRGGEAMPEEYKRLHDPIVALASAVSVTSRIRLGTGVMVIAQRERWRCLQQLAADVGRDPATLELTVYGSSGEPSVIAGHHDIGATRVVVGVGGDRDETLRQLDLHHPLIRRFEEHR